MLGVFFWVKDKKFKIVVLLISFIVFMGVIELVMYGVNMKYKKFFVVVMIGSVVGGGFVLVFGVKVYVFVGNGGFFGLFFLIG